MRIAVFFFSLWVFILSPIVANAKAIVDGIPEAMRQDVASILRQQLRGFSDVSLNILVSLPSRMPSVSHVTSYNYQLIAYSNYLGKSYIPVQFLDRNGVVIARAQYGVVANGVGSYVAAARQLSKGDVIVPSDLVVKRDTLLGQQRTGFGTIESVVGKEALSTIADGAMVTKIAVRTVPDVRRSSPVWVDFRKGPIQLRIEGTALSDAKVGERVKVRLKLESHRVMEGEVIDTTTVRIRSAY